LARIDQFKEWHLFLDLEFFFDMSSVISVVNIFCRKDMLDVCCGHGSKGSLATYIFMVCCFMKHRMCLHGMVLD